MNTEIKPNKKTIEWIIPILLIMCTYVFLVYLNAIFPVQSDDIGRKIGGIEAAVNSYKHWNGRIGELLLVSFGSYFATTPFFAPINGFIGTAVITLLFILLFGHFPNSSAQDIAKYCILVAFIMFDPVFCFGSVFYWAAGSFNYLWAWFLILLYLVPIVHFWRNPKSFENSSMKKNFWLSAVYILLGIAAGWASEFGIVFIVGIVASVIIARIQNKKLPTWYYTAFTAFIVGWLILYLCPGHQARTVHFSNYLSLDKLFKLGPVGFTMRVYTTFEKVQLLFYYYNFCFLALFLLLTTLLYKPSLKKIESTVLAILLLCFCLRSLPKVVFILCAVLVCLMSAMVIRNEYPELSRQFCFMTTIFVAAFLFIGATIQIGIPRRSQFQYTIVNYALIAQLMGFCFDSFFSRPRIRRIAAAGCVCMSLLFALCIGAACFKMHKKWNVMVANIQAQKEQGIQNVVIDKGTFKSRYWNYGDWGNPNSDATTWPNTTYATYFGVESLVAK